MPTQHNVITGADLHEPKGIAAAAAEKVYIANGSGSGAFGFMDPKGASSAAVGKVYSADGSGSGTFEYPVGKLFAELHITGSSTSQTLASGSAFAKLDPGTAWTQGQIKNLATVATDGTITISVTGVYLCNFWASFDGAAIAAGTKYNFKFSKDGSEETRKTTVQKMTASAERLYVNFSNIINFASTAALSVEVGGDGTSSGTAITVAEAGFSALRLTE